jgi:glycosyltransferase involved in cell wall biosynthesis
LEGLVKPLSKKLISIVIPAYNESECVDELFHRLKIIFDSESKYDFECVLVENGSDDDTFEKLERIHKSDSRFKVLQLARNFRMDGGLTAGLSVIKGDACVLMTADLQDPPELIPEFIRLWEQGFENIYGVVTRRDGISWIRAMNSKLFYWFAGKLTSGRITKNASDFRLVDKKVYEAVNKMTERNRFVRGLFAWVGFRSTGVEMIRPPRFGGVSNAHTLKVLDLAFKGIFAHSNLPLRFITVSGFALSAIAVIALGIYVVSAILYGVPFNGFGTLVSISLAGLAITTLLLGVIGEYLGLVYEEVKQRPNYVISKRIGID